MAALMSAALPGAGHIFLGRRLLGFFELAGGLALLGAALFNLGVVFMKVMRQEALPLELLRPTLPWGLTIVTYSAASGLFTWLLSRGRLVSSETEVQNRK
jgi:membrane protein implicated in regulation of membrane protease activity